MKWNIKKKWLLRLLWYMNVIHEKSLFTNLPMFLLNVLNQDHLTLGIHAQWNNLTTEECCPRNGLITHFLVFKTKEDVWQSN